MFNQKRSCEQVKLCIEKMLFSKVVQLPVDYMPFDSSYCMDNRKGYFFAVSSFSNRP